MATTPPLLALRDATLGFGGLPLFRNISAAIGRGDRICLVGRNGSGKSTLMKVLAGLVELDFGERFIQPGTAVAYLPQDPAVPHGTTVGDYACADGAPRHLAVATLESLGIDPDRDTAGLSGGEARRAALARAFAGEPDILLLDEPTNHLDLQAIEWLEGILVRPGPGVLTVSHDRRFLETVTRQTWWLRNATLCHHDRGYRDFDAWAESVAEAEAAALARITQHLKAEDRYRQRGVTARRRRNQRRLRRLAELREERGRLMRRQGQVALTTADAPESGRLTIEAENITKAYGDRTVIADFSTRIRRGDRIGIVGPNGAGKTTLLDILTGVLLPDSGRVRIGERVTIARFDQLRAQLDPEASLWETLCPGGGDSLMVGGRQRHVVAYLKDFLFAESQARSPVRSLSGGETNRLLLAKVLAAPANVLALDEPTNDLDMDTLDVLEDVLEGFEGTLLLVSHDRDFLERLVNGIIAVEGDGRAAEYAGGYDDYRRLITQRSPGRQPASVRQSTAPGAAAAAPPRSIRPRLGYRETRELQELPKRIAAHEAEIAALEAALADADLFRRDPAGFEAKAARLRSARADKAALEDQWLALEIRREAMQEPGA